MMQNTLDNKEGVGQMWTWSRWMTFSSITQKQAESVDWIKLRSVLFWQVTQRPYRRFGDNL